MHKKTVVSKNVHTMMKPIVTSIRRACVPVVSLCFALHPPVALAAPEGGQVVAGQGSITKPTEQSTVIQQRSEKLAIDWRSFNVDADELVQFKQPSSKASALNRIHDQNPSQIFGGIEANGKVILVNPNGIFFSPTATVNTNGLIASGLDIDTNNFINEQYEFNANGEAKGVVVNQGVLKAATGGSVTLIGEAVQNAGVILAEVGQVNLVAGKQVVVDFDGDGLMQFAITKEVVENSQSLDATVHNTGDIIAEGGSVLLTGKASKDIFNNVVNNEGLIRAGRIENKGGSIQLIAGGTSNSLLNTGVLDARGYRGDGGSVTLQATGDVVTSNVVDVSATKVASIINVQGNQATLEEPTDVQQHGDSTSVASVRSVAPDSIIGDGGTIHIESHSTTLVTEDATVSARSDTGKGGNIHILGKKVGLFDQTVVDASGENGGGRILVGGDFQGQNTDIQNAKYTYVSDDVSIKVNAKTSQDGGEVIIWSDEVTRFYGEVSATGGIEGGDGGFTEISGKRKLDYQGTVDLNAVRGQAGEVLFDPQNITFASIADMATTGFVPVVADQTQAFTDDAGVDSVFNIDGTGVLIGVNDGATITFQATSDITIQDAFNLNTATGASNVAIVLQAGNNINVNALLTLDGSGSAMLTANDTSVDSTPTGMGSIIFGTDGAINSENGAISLAVMSGGGNISGATIITETGDITLASANLLAINDDITTTLGVVSLTGTGITQFASSTVDAGSGRLTLDGNDGAITTLSGTLRTSNTGTAALRIFDMQTVSLGTIEVSAGTLVLGGGGGWQVAGAVTQTGAITAATLTGNAGGTVTLDNAGNQIGNLGAFTSVGGFTLVDGGGGLTVTGVVTDTTGDISLTTTGGALAISEVINNAGQVLTLSGVGVMQTAGMIQAMGMSVDGGTGSIALAQANNDFTGDVTLMSMGDNINIVDMNDLTLTGLTLGANTGIRAVATGGTLSLPAGIGISTGTGSIELRSSNVLTTPGALRTTTGDITLASANSLTIDDDITTISGNVNLTGIGITQSVGSTVDAGSGRLTLDGNDGAITLSGTLRTSNASDTALQIIDAATVSLGTIEVSDGALVLGNTGGDNISGAVTQTGAINADTLTGNVGAVVVLGNTNNQIGNLGAFTSVGGFTLVDGGGGLIVAGALSDMTGDISLTTTGGALAINDNITTSGVVNLAATDITQFAGSTITADTLTGNASGTVTLDSTNNQIGNLGAFTSVGGFTLVDSMGGLTIAGAVTDMTGDISITVDGGADDEVSLDFRSAMLNAGGVINFIGQGDNDTLLAPNFDNNWTINALNAGQYQSAGFTVNFTGFANLTGNSMADSFTVNDTAGIDGLYDGGAGNDTIILTPYTTVATVTLTALGTDDGMSGGISTDTTRIGDFNNINVIIGTGNADTLMGLDMSAVWTIDGTTTGIIDDVTTERYTVGGQFLDFSNDFRTLHGGNLVDTFNISADYTGSFSGGDGADVFMVSGSAIVDGVLDGEGGGDVLNIADYGSAVTINAGTGTSDGTAGSVTADAVGSTVAMFNNIDNVVTDSSSVSQTFQGMNSDTIWTIDGTNTGIYDSGTGVMRFNGFNIIRGGTANDTFVFTTGVVDTINGGGGAGTDAIVVDTGMNEVFNFTGADAGNIVNIGGFDVTVNFSSINNVFADFDDATDDMFNINEGVEWGGTIAGGLGQDTLSILGASASTWEFTGTGTRSAIHGISDAMTPAVDGTSGSVNGGSFIEMEIVNGSGAVDTFNIQAIDAALTINGEDGRDIFNVSSTSGTVNEIAATLTLDGNSGQDILNLIDSGDTGTNTGAIRDSSITGFGLGGMGINYSRMNTVNVTLGTGADTVDATVSFNSFTVNTGGGNDTVSVDAGMSSFIVNTGAGNDTVNVFSGFSFLGIAVNTGAGSDIINVGDTRVGTTGLGGTIDIATTITIDGGDLEGSAEDVDILNINNQGLTAADLDGDVNYVLRSRSVGSVITPEITINLNAAGDLINEQTSSIFYTGIEQLDLKLGENNDNISASFWEAGIRTGNITDAGGMDTFSIDAGGGFTITENFTIQDIEILTSQAGQVLAAAQLSIINASSIGSSSAPFLTNIGSLQILTNIGSLQITDSGPTNIQELDAIQLLDITTGRSDFTLVTTDGSITVAMGTSITTTANVFLTAGGDAASIGATGNLIRLNNVEQITAMAAQGAGGIFLQQTTGDLNVASATADTGAITLMSDAALIAGALNGGALIINSATSSTLNGAIDVVSADITATTIDLNNTLMSTEAVEITNSGLFATSSGAPSSGARITANGGFSASGDVRLADNIITANTAISISGSLQIADNEDVMLSTGTNGGRIGIDGMIDGTAGGGDESLLLESGGAISGVDNTRIGDITGLTDITISSADSARFGRIGITGNLNFSDISTSVIFQEGIGITGNLNFSDISTSVIFQAGIDIGGSSTFTNIGLLTLGSAADDVFNFNGGIMHTSGTTNIMGSINTMAAAVAFSDITLLADTRIITGAGANSADSTIVLADVDNGGFGLSLDAGEAATISIGSFSQAGVPLTGSVTIIDSAGTTFSGMVNADTVILDSSSGEVQFMEVVNTNSLTVNEGAYSVAFLENLTVNDLAGVTFSNTGTVTLGDSNDDSYRFNGAVSIISPQAANLAGIFETTNGAFMVGAFAGAGNDVTIVADEIDFTGGSNSITNIGTLSLSQYSDIGVIIGGADADVAGPALNISSNDIVAMQNGVTNIVIGRDGRLTAQLRGDINVGTSNLALRGERITFIDDTTLTATTTTFNAPIFDDDGDNVTFNSSVVLNGTVNDFNASPDSDMALHDGWDVDNLIFNNDLLTVNGYVLLEATGSITYPINVIAGTDSTLAIVPLEGADQSVGGTGGMVVPVAPFAGYSGHLILGGSMEEEEDGTVVSVDINAQSITLSEDLATQGSVTFLAGDIELGANIMNTGTDSRLIFTAGGADPLVGSTAGTGVIRVVGAVTLTGATDHIFIAADEIVNSRSLNIATSGGSGIVEVATSASTVEFGSGSNFEIASENSLTFSALLELFSTDLNVAEIEILNPATDLLGQETIGFIDTGLFEKDLTLFGQIGTGIALSLSQCEEIEGCAPNVTLEELDGLIAELKARLETLEQRLSESSDTSEKSELQDLYAGYQKSLADFMIYRETLQEHLAFEEAEDDFGDEFLDEFADQSGAIHKLGIILENINARIQWLEELKDKPQQRNHLKEAVGIDLTQEVLEHIIDSTKAEIRFIERQIKLLQEGTRAAIGTLPLFIAEAGDDQSIQNINYGDRLWYTNSYDNSGWLF
ncbi:Alkaline phosphatase [uncultured Candidatus Thioglobus sp.]|nr:Alkaline phosphatase [uncultured Candidatus Thioglobus sp.]